MLTVAVVILNISAIIMFLLIRLAECTYEALVSEIKIVLDKIRRLKNGS